MCSKNQLQIKQYIHKEYYEKYDIIKSSFIRIFIGEDFREEEIEDRLHKFLATNEKSMLHKDRFYFTTSKQK